jgi:hypothetical protein
MFLRCSCQTDTNLQGVNEFVRSPFVDGFDDVHGQRISGGFGY